ncbi:Flocculation suppression protein [Pichia kudriavzevii]|uniref:Flocculation suppression protein n=1 Tax=Pichia kudriavzevii TaxID=4909 RepID=A0A1V2LQR5_PICKU|nr:Flocculation suppression protein [Pichia kudriavzevii]
MAVMPAPSTVTPSASSESVKTVKQTSSPSFIHKLYAMLEEPEMDELIWWHENQTNFFVRPCEEFTKNLSNNTNPNIGSVNAEKDNKDEKPTGDKDAGNSSRNLDNNHGQIWEFKHNSGVFRKGNVEGLNSIKRRSFKNTPDKESKLVYDIPPVPYSTTLHNVSWNTIEILCLII